jgi:outer membrane protein assembly factor BamA
VQEFFASSRFASQADFNRLDATNASYYPFGNVRRYVFARQTRIAYERSYGNGGQELIPLPERIYAGGAQSLRGFGINAAGPRDSETGFPIGGAAAFVNTFEMRFPPPVLPYVGNSVSFVLFHDMGNVFVKGSDIWPSFTRFHQPDKNFNAPGGAGCFNISETAQAAPSAEKNSIGFNGLCSYNYFTHDIGLGVRYHTPIGPIRLDSSYNLNPPVYPAIQNYSLTTVNGVVEPTPPYTGRAGHFNFFFSIGQTF